MERVGDIINLEKIRTQSRTGDTGTSSGADSTDNTEGNPECPVCQGVGWISPDVPFGDPDFGKGLPCKCLRAKWEAKLPERFALYSNIGPLARLTFDNLIPQGRTADEDNRRLFQVAYDEAKKYADNPNGWLVLIGASGSGKTHLAAAITNHCIQSLKRTFFMVVPDLLDHLRATFGPNSAVTYDELFDQVRNVPILILDDLGVQRSSPWASEKLFQILNHRFNAQLPTVITTNVDIDRLDENLKTRLTDPQLSKVIQVERRSSALGLMDNLRLELPIGMTFETFKPSGRGLKGDAKENLEGAYRAALSFAKSLDGWMVLQGPTGRGKTHLAAAIAHHHRQLGKDSLFLQVSDLLDYLRSTYAPDANITYDELFKEIRNVSLLVLDDYSEQASTPWAKEKLYQIINHRYNRRLPTVLTTSLELEEMEDRISSRLADPALTILFSIDEAPDYRSGEARRNRPRRGEGMRGRR